MSTEVALSLRLGRLEQLVEHLYAHLGISLPERPTGVSDRVREVAASGNVIQAIKLHRDETGKSLADAKADIDALM